MKRIIRYVKPYWGYIAIMVVLLFCQAAVDLNLPNLMSDIVNVGIQRSGITETAPEAIDAAALMLMTRFASDDDAAALNTNYQPFNQKEMPDKERKTFEKKYPVCEDANILKLSVGSSEEQRKTEHAFERACYAFTQALLSMRGEASPDKDMPAADVLKEDIAKFLAAVPQGTIDKAIAAAQSAPDMMLEQTAGVFIKSFYTQLGTDIGSVQTRYILTVGGKMLMLTLLLAACAISVGFCASRLGTGIARDLRHDVFTRVTTFTNNEYDSFGTASLITRSTNDVMQIRMMLSMGLRTLLYAPILGIGGIIMALNKSAGMAWIIALACVVIFGVVTVIFAIAVPKFKVMQKLVDKLNLVSRENLSGMMVIRAFATQKFEEDRFADANKKLADNNLFVYRTMAVMMPTMMLIMNAVSLLIVWIGGRRIAASAMQVGDMMAFIQYAMQIIMSFLMISLMFVMIPRAVVSANRIKEVLECESSVKDAENPLHLPEKVKGIIEFKDVSFKYEGADENVLEHISFTARPGETTAFIGSTGSGKSTLINLIPRFYDVTEGKITLDGIDISALPQQELRSVIGYIPQKGMLFSGDIASNLRYGDENADEQALHDALETAQAAEFVDEMPQGLSTAVSQGGTSVSGGQRQRLSIARALVKKAPVYIFDDTFSALDFKTDAKLRAALKKRTENAAVLIVAQRVSTIMHAEQIIVLDKGKAVGIGTHKELLENCKTYREIAESQLSKEELA